MNGLFIVIEGIDGAGKGYAMMRLQEYVMGKSKSYDHLLLTREPTYGPVGRQIRELLASEKDPYSDPKKFAELYAKDRSWHVSEHILPALEKGYVVLCDRYKYSSMAFQQAQGLSFDYVYSLNNGFPNPDLVLLLDLPVPVALNRMSERGKSEKFEEKKFMEILRQKYLELPKRLPEEKIAVIDSSQTRDSVYRQIVETLEASHVLPF